MSDQVPGEPLVIRFQSNDVDGVEASEQVIYRFAFRKYHVVYHCQRRYQFCPRRGLQDRGCRSVHDHDQGAGSRSCTREAQAVPRKHRIEMAGDKTNLYAAFAQLPYD
jgi:hypothetical protein